MKKLNRFALISIIAALMVVMAACGNGANNAGNNNQNTTSGSLVISGSSAMQPLVAAAAEQYMNNHSNVDVQVNAGGSGTGLSQVAQGSVAIGNSDIFAEEKDSIDASKLVDHKVAVVGMAPIVNPGVGLTNISKADLIKVFTGKVKNWKEVGGADQKIVLVNRPDSSGTRATFVKYALDGNTPAEGLTEDSSNTVLKIIADTKGAIGYEAFSYIKGKSVTALSVDGVAPTKENVENGTFPIWAYEHSYTKGEAKGAAKDFIDYLLSNTVQSKLVPQQGYIPVSEMKVERDAKGNQTKK